MIVVVVGICTTPLPLFPYGPPRVARTVLTLSQVVDQSVLKQVDYAYVYSFITYGIIFWGNAPLSRKVFLKQKKIIRIMMNSPRRASCRPLFLASGILPLPSVYILYSVLFVKMN